MRREVASAADCAALATTSKLAFDADVELGAPGPGGPPGYDSVAWHVAALRWGRVFTISDRDEPLGGAIVIPRGPSAANLGRVWLVPAAQHRGLGAAVLAELESRFPLVRRWTLETPVWNQRNRHFYRNCGYREVGVRDDEVLFEKLIAAPAGSAEGSAQE